ncbi:hypothetical protein QBC42DRAFT_263835 [Cladorrhinum samala]|uniref:Uncharacterized protein n=1 Tax=Cladorrhinum samala TaxID=585594 RepID=A0AAV9HU84_9PEZI|nr:hypothetical protein QBC42DRAFT_263835 [Cladorrhinum samala]
MTGRRLPPPEQTQTEWRGPEIYLHLEFRVAWSKKQQQQPAKPHQVTYRSRGSRERAPAFPRQVPAPNTNYLAAIHDFDQRQAHLRDLRQRCVETHPQRGHGQLQEYYQVHEEVPRGRQQQVPIIQEPQHRATRADSRSSYERGRSAPPPFGENPWDVNVSRGGVSTKKALPAVPSQFRLGEGREPWSTWSLPPTFDAGMFSSEGSSAEDRDTQRDSIAYATTPAMVSTFSPESCIMTREQQQQQHQRVPTPPPITDPVSTGKQKELGALAAAMVTVDNGFENQWWYQGHRKGATGEDDDQAQTSAVAAPIDSPVFPDHLNHRAWPSVPATDLTASASVHGYEGEEEEGTLPTGIVSPMTEAAFSPAPGFASLHRSMSTRSEELWLSDKY